MGTLRAQIYEESGARQFVWNCLHRKRATCVRLLSFCVRWGEYKLELELVALRQAVGPARRRRRYICCGSELPQPDSLTGFKRLLQIPFFVVVDLPR